MTGSVVLRTRTLILFPDLRHYVERKSHGPSRRSGRVMHLHRRIIIGSPHY